MGDVIPMDGLSRGAKPEGKRAENPGQSAPGITGGKLEIFEISSTTCVGNA